MSFVNGAKLVCNVGAGGAVIDTAGFTVGFGANLMSDSVSGGLVKQGTGTLILNGSNTYSGVTSVEAGALKLSAQASLPATNATHLSAETLASLKLRLDASDASTLFTNSNGSGAVTESGQTVGCWADLSGNNKLATQTASSRRPTYVTGATGFNGLPVLQFDGTDDNITSLLDINATNLPNVTLLIVYRELQKSGNAGLWGHDNGGWDRLQLFYNGGTYYQVAAAGTSLTVKGMEPGKTTLYTAVLKNGVVNGSSVYINGKSDSSAGLPAFTSSEDLVLAGQPSFTLGSISKDHVGYCGKVQIGEVLVFDTALSDADRCQAEAYLRDKWLVLPGSVDIASGTVLDLDGAAQTLSAVSGSGTISNGTLTVTEPLSPADDQIGTLKVSNVALNGTLLVNVTEDGACDQMVGTGNLTVTGLTLHIANLSRLNREKPYTVIQCAGLLTGPFAGNNLPGNWHVRYDQAVGTAVFYYAAPGTLLRVM